MDITLKRNEYHMGGHSLRLSTRYDVSRLWSAGIGIGLDRYTEPDYNTMPVFATVRYKALEKVPDAYVFADMGYAIKSGEFTYVCEAFRIEFPDSIQSEGFQRHPHIYI